MVILSVGEVNKNKNHKVGIEALAKLHDKHAWYVVCGRGPLVEEHIALAQSLGVDHRVVFTGYRTDVADFYHTADIFLFPSFREGLPVAVMEALASGLPVVATKIRGSSNLVEDGINGVTVEEPTDAEAFAAAITRASGMRIDTAQVQQFEIESLLESFRHIYFD